jgi:hypothetical protein
MSRTTSPVRIPDAADAQLYLANVTANLPDAPPFTDDVRQYAPYKPFPGEDWAAFKARIDMSHAGAAAANDPALPVWDPTKFVTIATEDAGEQHLMDKALSNAFYAARPLQHVGYDNEIARAVLLKLADLAGACGLLPHTTDPNTTEFAWAPVRCLFAAGGHRLHHELCQKFSHEPGFPWGDETEAEWDASVRQAHAAQGWPTTVALVRWTALSRLPEPNEEMALPNWMYWRAWVHVLTVLRYDHTDNQLRMVHDGKCVMVALESTTNLLAHQRRALPIIMAGLGCVSEVQKKAALYVLNRLTTGDLLGASAYSDLPYTVIAGRWSKLQSDRSVDGWSEAKMRVSNAWVAGGGVIEADLTDEEAVLNYSWPTFPMKDDMVEDLDAFKTGVPDRYHAVWPSEVLTAAFPNLTNCGISDPVARAVMFDVILVADMLRSECPCLRGEYPMFVVLPDVPTLTESVNQGKTTLCLQYAKASVPGLSRAMKFRDSASAPDQRAIADELRRMGTICLDEFSIPRSDNALLSRSNMASITTGGAIPMGLVLKNSNEEVSLKHPLFMSSKALDMTEDLLTRSICLFLRDLTDAEKNAEGVWEFLKTTKLAILMRLGALEKIQRHGLADKLNKMKHSAAGWRFGAHRSVAILLYQLRTSCPLAEAEQAIKIAVAENKVRMMDHARTADDQGVIMSQRESRDMRITLEQLFADVTGNEVKVMADFIVSRSSTSIARMASRTGMKGLMQARMAVDGRQDQPLSVGFNQLTNLGMSVGERMVSNLLANEIKRRIPEQAAWRLPGIAGAVGWFLYRHKGRGDGSLSVTLVHEPKQAEHALLHGDLDEPDPS